MSVTADLEKIKEEMCDGYCKYPEIYENKDLSEDEAVGKLFDEKCVYCPLGRI